MKWSLSSTGSVYDRDEGASVYYHSSSGNTHLISDFAVRTLQLVDEQSRTMESLNTAIREDVEGIDDDGCTQMLTDVLSELESLDLIECT